MSLLSILFGTKKEKQENITILDRMAYAEAIMVGKVQLVDVRTSKEYKSGHIKNAVNIDFFSTSSFKKFFEKFDKEKAVYLYCRSGARSQKAARRLVDLGFSNIYDLKGGYMRWGY